MASLFCGQQRRQVHMLLEGIGEAVKQLVPVVAVVGPIRGQGLQLSALAQLI